jgi:hypothetical protein
VLARGHFLGRNSEADVAPLWARTLTKKMADCFNPLRVSETVTKTEYITNTHAMSYAGFTSLTFVSNTTKLYGYNTSDSCSTPAGVTQAIGIALKVADMASTTDGLATFLFTDPLTVSNSSQIVYFANPTLSSGYVGRYVQFTFGTSTCTIVGSALLRDNQMSGDDHISYNYFAGFVFQ